MDKISIKELLESTFGDMFLFHPEFLIEYDELIKESGEVRKINKLLVRRLYAIIELGDPDDGLPWLEHLKAYDNMYSLHINTNTQNYRLLFSKSSNKVFSIYFQSANLKLSLAIFSILNIPAKGYIFSNKNL